MDCAGINGVNRRVLLKLIAAAALAGCSSREGSAKHLRVVVAGAGIVGASIAYHLSKLGASVTVIDQEGPATHASRGTFAWINATWAKQPRDYHRLNQDGLSSWMVLQRDLDIPIRWSGSLEWIAAAERQERLRAQIAEQVEWGEKARFVTSSELSELEPNVDFGAAQQVAFSENDGAVDPVMATKTLLSAAQEMGALIRYPCKLTDVALSAGKVIHVSTTTGRIETDKVVLATGAAPDVARRFAESDVPQRSTPGVIAITAPIPQLLNRILVAPGIHMHQREDGRFVLGEQDGAPQNEAHAMRLEHRPNNFPAREIAKQHANRMMVIANDFFRILLVPKCNTPTSVGAPCRWMAIPCWGSRLLGQMCILPSCTVEFR